MNYHHQDRNKCSILKYFLEKEGKYSFYVEIGK